MIAEVIVDISNSEVDRIFDYFFESADVKKGSRVSVPFGNRKIEGYVIGIKSDTLVPKDKLKAVCETLDDRPVIGEEMLELMRFMCERYHLRVVDALRLFIPSQMRGGRIIELKKRFVRISPEYADKDPSEFIRASAKAQHELFEYVRACEEADTAYISKEYSAAALRNLIDRGIFEAFEKAARRMPYKSVGGAGQSVELTSAQRAAVDAVRGACGEIFLLHGVTGSGKTEVYMNAIAAALERGKTAIMLEPEISLTPQVLKNFRARFGDSVAILHSGLSAGERFDEWRRLLCGEAKVAVGARSAIFAPLSDLGLIIIDEEHDASYVSDSNPRYSTEEVAAFRAKYNNCNLVMGSATPSVESYYKAKAGEYKLLELRERIASRPLPDIEIVNMCDELRNGNNGFLSRRLSCELAECLERGEQAIIFINRRGYASFVMCAQCGYVAKCERCDVSLVYHRDENVLKCHYCNNRYAPLDVCPQCKGTHLRQGYIGTQKVAAEISKMFPSKKVLRMDNDTTRNKDAHLEILGRFGSREADVLVGTQMIAKGHDFPNVTLVGIIDADMSLHFADYRAAERTFQLITQVSGRAGRDVKPGKVVLQTYSPGHYVYKLAARNDYRGFFEKECNLREVTKYPPFSKIVRILITSESESDAFDALKADFDDINALARENADCFAYLAAMKAPLKRIQDKYRVQIIARITENFDSLIQKIYEITDSHYSSKTTCFVEINPSNMS
ncbi:replication restart helicase PriA [Pumilibacter intestinalis]|uniref:replication restart helicase PriA n=1 Tax=Pumilibacter intestinalis TaxID=2941511 RepID=UPI00203F074B|nr:primosomal protein N' [Pumilibacter intestinalis]